MYINIYVKLLILYLFFTEFLILISAKTGGQKNSETNSTSTVKHNLVDDIQSLQRSRIIRKQLLSSSNPKPVLEEVIPERVNENYTSLFDDDADDCMVRCSQEVEEKLHEPDLAACGAEQKHSSDLTVALPSRNSDVVENILQNCKYSSKFKMSLPLKKCYFRIKSENVDFFDVTLNDLVMNNYQTQHKKVNRGCKCVASRSYCPLQEEINLWGKQMPINYKRNIQLKSYWRVKRPLKRQKTVDKKKVMKTKLRA